MFKTNLPIALRVLRRNKAFSILNVLGLSIGVAASILIFLVIRWETGYDSYHKNKDRIYRVVTTVVNRSNGETASQHAYAPVSLGDVIRNEVAGIEKTAAVLQMPPWQVHTGPKGSADAKVFLEKNMYAAEPELFSMLDVYWLDGSAVGLKDPSMAVVSASAADKWFGSWTLAVGKTIEMGSPHMPLKIVGVFRDLPANTDIPFELVESYATLRDMAPGMFTLADRWHYPAKHSEDFVLLDRDATRSGIEVQLAGIVKKYYGEDQGSYKTYSRLGLQPLTDMHLDDRFETYRGDALSKKVLWSLGLIGILLLVVACINFINLSTAQSVKRSKEVGVRKVLGSDRWQLMRQFMVETGVITLMALVTGCILAQLALPWLQQVMGKPVTAEWFHSPTLLLFLFITAVTVVLFAGFYPAVVLSGFDVIAAIKSRITTSTVGGLSLRRSLVVIQFVIAQLLITGTIVIVRQMAYFRTRPMGFDRTAVAMLELPGNIKYTPMQPFLKRTMLQIPGVEAAGLSNDGPSGGIYWPEQRVFFDRSSVAQDWKADVQISEPDFIKAMRIPLVAGVMPDTNRREVLVNETLVKRLGLHSMNDVIGKSLALDADSNVFTVTGVVHDYNHQSLREAIGPVVVKPEGGGYNYLVLRLQPDHIRTTIAQVQRAFAGVYPDYLFDCSWLDERVAHFYEAEETTSRLVKSFAGLAIMLSCMGLYGLVAFLTVQKMKEVGIRKVLGASVGSIVLLFSKEFLILTVVAFLISAPVGYMVMQRWLNGFYYHVDLGWWVFVLTLGLSLGIAWVTVGWQALKAATVNPVKSLKAE